MFQAPDLMEGETEHLVFSDKDEKLRRSRVHVAHVKDPLAVENRERAGLPRPLPGQNFQTLLNSLPLFRNKATDFLYNPLILDLLGCPLLQIISGGQRSERRRVRIGQITLSTKCPGKSAPQLISDRLRKRREEPYIPLSW